LMIRWLKLGREVSKFKGWQVKKLTSSKVGTLWHIAKCLTFGVFD
jgi:hypothetical protein